MKAPRGQCAVACMPDNRLFAMGGTDSIDSLRSVECYGEANGDVSWHYIPPMNDRRNKPLAAAFRSSLIVMGGWHDAGHIDHCQVGGNFVNSIEIFDTKTNGQWTVHSIHQSLALFRQKTLFVSLLSSADGVLAFGKHVI